MRAADPALKPLSRRLPGPSAAALGLVVLAGCALILGLQIAAWACIPQAKLVTVQPRSSSPAGSEVTINALGLDAGRAEIRWNAPDGKVLATATGPNFSAPLTIPDAPEGLYALVVLSRQADGSVGNTATASFQVGGSAGPGGQPAESPFAGGRPESKPPKAPSASPSRLAMAVVVLAALALGALGGARLGPGRRRSEGQ